MYNEKNWFLFEKLAKRKSLEENRTYYQFTLECLQFLLSIGEWLQCFHEIACNERGSSSTLLAAPQPCDQESIFCREWNPPRCSSQSVTYFPETSYSYFPVFKLSACLKTNRSLWCVRYCLEKQATWKFQAFSERIWLLLFSVFRLKSRTMVWGICWTYLPFYIYFFLLIKYSSPYFRVAFESRHNLESR